MLVCWALVVPGSHPWAKQMALQAAGSYQDCWLRQCTQRPVHCWASSSRHSHEASTCADRAHSRPILCISSCMPGLFRLATHDAPDGQMQATCSDTDAVSTQPNTCRGTRHRAKRAAHPAHYWTVAQGHCCRPQPDAAASALLMSHECSCLGGLDAAPGMSARPEPGGMLPSPPGDPLGGSPPAPYMLPGGCGRLEGKPPERPAPGLVDIMQHAQHAHNMSNP